MTIAYSHHRNLPGRTQRERGFALIVVLCFIVLLTVVAIAYINRSMTAHQLAFGSGHQSRADEFALGALNVVVGNLRQEIANPANSSSTTYGPAANPYIVYRPLGSANVLPARAGNPSGTPDPTPNLIRRSWSGDTNALLYPSQASAVNSTTDISLNGRNVSLARWNSHYLLPRSTGAADTDSTPVSSFVAPDWVLVTDNTGPTALTAPNSHVIGRYAYAIYDEGGLLDVNTAGYPSNSSVAQYGDKPGLAYADLTQVGLSAADVDNLVGYRNYASVQPTGSFGSFSITTTSQLQNFFNLITSNTTGFLTVNPGSWNSQTDQAFVNRQQLLKYRVSEGFPATALQYLGTYSRDLNAPTWSPYTPSGSTINYTSLENTSTSANRDLLGVRVVNSFARADGTTAQVGEPLLKHRFPLSRLAGLTYQGIDTTDSTTLINGVVSPASAATIQRDFGLVWSTDHWNYCGPSGTTIQSSIATLDSVANSSPGREPNFFELLKAAILSGSLGQNAGSNGAYQTNYEEGPASGVYKTDLNTDLQIIQIGANIIDQSDTDSYPTEIHLLDANNGSAETPVYGVENLPYIQRVFTRMIVNDPTYSPVKDSMYGWFLAEIWNPHQSSGYTNTLTIPKQFRFDGSGYIELWTPDGGVSGSQYIGSYVTLSNDGYIQFTVDPIQSPNLCRDPTFLSNDSNNKPYLAPTQIVNSVSGNAMDGATPPAVIPNDPYKTGQIAGLAMGWAKTNASANYNSRQGGMIPLQPCALQLQYLASDGVTWKTYDTIRNMSAKQAATIASFAWYYGHVDPRTDRFGTTLGQWTFAPSVVNPPGASIRYNTGQGNDGVDYFPRPSAGFVYPNNNDSSIFGNFYMGMLSDNVSSGNPSNPYYKDPDGIVRSGEGAYATGNDGRPLILGNTTSRPIVLNRPFRNVGELGYAFRDLPWKNVDFFTPNSADAGLLDFFCVNESTSSTAEVAGKLNLNTRQAPVLQAMIAGVMKDEAGGLATPQTVPPVATSDAQNVATAIVNWTTSSSAGEGPFQNRSELVSKATSIMVSSAASTADQQIKIRREAALRALSDVGATRVWNLMIDVIAQTGQYPPGSTKLSQFVVQGEKRYWLHIAIDRYTGQVIDRSLEPVYE